MQEILTALLLSALTALVPVVGIVFKALGQKAATWIQAKVDNATLEGILVRLNSAAFSAVTEVYQSTAEALKAGAADGKLSDEDKARVKQTAIDSVKSYLGPKGIEVLMAVMGLKSESELDKAIGGKVEGAIYQLKRNSANRIDPVTMAH